MNSFWLAKTLKCRKHWNLCASFDPSSHAVITQARNLACLRVGFRLGVPDVLLRFATSGLLVTDRNQYLKNHVALPSFPRRDRLLTPNRRASAPGFSLSTKPQTPSGQIPRHTRAFAAAEPDAVPTRTADSADSGRGHRETLFPHRWGLHSSAAPRPAILAPEKTSRPVRHTSVCPEWRPPRAAPRWSHRGLFLPWPIWRPAHSSRS